MKQYFKKILSFCLLVTILSGNFVFEVKAERVEWTCENGELVEIDGLKKCIEKKEILENGYSFSRTNSNFGRSGVQYYDGANFTTINSNINSSFRNFFYGTTNSRAWNIGFQMFKNGNPIFNDWGDFSKILNVPVGGKAYIISAVGDDNWKLTIDGDLKINRNQGSEKYDYLTFYPIFLEEGEHTIVGSYFDESRYGGLAFEIIGPFEKSELFDGDTPKSPSNFANFLNSGGAKNYTLERTNRNVQAPSIYVDNILWNINKAYLNGDNDSSFKMQSLNICEEGFELSVGTNLSCIKISNAIENKFFEVIFQNEAGVELKKIEKRDGEKILDSEKNSDLEKENHDFLGWGKNGETELFDFETIIDSDIILVPKFSLKEALIKYEFKNISNDLDLPEEVKNLLPSEKKVFFTSENIPENLSKTSIETDAGVWNFEGYTEQSWIADSSEKIFIGNWSFSEYHNVIFENEDNSIIKTISKILNNTIIDSSDIPTSPEKENYTFLNWIKKGTDEVIDFSEKIVENFSVIPKFDKKPVFSNITLSKREITLTKTVKYVKAGDVVVITLNLAEADSWKQNYNKATFKIGNGPEKETRAFTSTKEVTSRNVTYTVSDGEDGPFLFTALKFKDEFDGDIVGFVAPYTPVNNIIVDTEAPKLDKDIEDQHGKDNQNFSFEIPLATDNYEIASVEVSGLDGTGLIYNSDNRQISGILSTSGEKEILVAYIDGAGNRLEKSFKIIVDKRDSEKENNNPTAKTEIQEIFFGENFVIENSINTDGLTNNPKYSWKNKPDNQKIGEQKATILVTYDDLSFDEVEVNLVVKPLSEKYFIETEKQIIEVKNEILAKSSIKNLSVLPEKIDISWSEEPKNNVVENNVSGKIKIIFEDNSFIEKEILVDIVDTTKPTISGEKEFSFEVGSENAKNFDISLSLTIEDNYSEDLAATCVSSPDFDFEKVGKYIISCTTSDEAGNSSDVFERKIIINSIDKQKLIDLLQKITDDFQERKEKIKNNSDFENAKNELEKAIENPNLTREKLENIFEKFKNLVAIRDEEAPIGTIISDNENLTNQNVKLTLSVNESIKTPDGWTKLDEKTFEKIFENNEEVSLILEDDYGNIGNIDYSITNIDKIAPKIIFTSDNENPTNKDVKITLTTDEEILSLEGWTKIDKKTFEKVFENNEDFEVTVTDLAGNISTKKYSIKNIDKILPEGEILGEPTIWTNENILLTLKTTKDIETPEGWEKVDDKTFTKIFEENTVGNLVLVDKVGNSSANISYKVEKIDKEKPIVTSLTVEGDKTLIQSASVKINFSGTDSGGSGIKNFECSLNDGDFIPCEAEFTVENLIEGENRISVRVLDNAGNISEEKNILVTKDTTPPKFLDLEDKIFDEKKEILEIILKTDSENDKIFVKSTLPDGLSYNSENKKISGIPTSPGIYTVELEALDEAGNKISENFQITINDKTSPEILISGEEEIILVKGQKYFELGASCNDNFDETCEVFISGEVDENSIGLYEITYSASDKAGNNSIKTRKISVVVGEIPVIKIIGDEKIIIELGEKYFDLHAEANDFEDGNISEKIEVLNEVNSEKLGVYEVKYNVSDSSGNKAFEKIRIVEIVDTTLPNITKISDKNFDENTDISPIKIEVSDLNPILNILVENLPKGLIFNAEKNQIEGKTSEVGEFFIKILATDGSGNKSEEIFNLKINDTTEPIVELNDLKIISKENVSNYEISGTCTVGDLEVELKIGLLDKTAVCDEDGNFKIILDLQEIEDSENLEIIAKQSDISGNISEVSKKSVKKDTTSPVINLENIKVKNKLNGTGENLLKISEKKYFLKLNLGDFIDFNSFLAEVYDEKFDKTRNISDLKDIFNDEFSSDNGIFEINKIGTFEFKFITKDSVGNISEEVILEIEILENNKEKLLEEILRAKEKINSTLTVNGPEKEALKNILEQAENIFSNPNSTYSEIENILNQLKKYGGKLSYSGAPNPGSLVVLDDSRVIIPEKVENKIEETENISENIEKVDLPKEEKNLSTKTVTINGERRSYELRGRYGRCPMIPNILGDYEKDYEIIYKDLEEIINKEEVQRLAKVDVVNKRGVNNTELFEPLRGITRSEFLAIVLKVHCYDVSKKAEYLPYSDVDLETWQSRVIKVANEIGIIRGYEDGTFRPDREISKIEAFGIMMKMAEVKKVGTYEDSYIDKKADWQKEPLSTGEYLGILRPSETDYKFNPDGKLTRDEMVKLIVDIIKLY